ncbi:hypothetical protein MVI01_08800 [Myxococcus virescens]|uniref:Uncharacterized protein n=1 Tax=Myxococcus virescens TaxID=83456 RepID=A0A511H6E9_9BACT|nr:hypothetical protein MVI01_08800 [Myxococcus virescens]
MRVPMGPRVYVPPRGGPPGRFRREPGRGWGPPGEHAPVALDAMSMTVDRNRRFMGSPYLPWDGFPFRVMMRSECGERASRQATLALKRGGE